MAQDIKEFKEIYIEKSETKKEKHLYQYSVNTALNAIKQWSTLNENMQCYIAYENKNARNIPVGFVHFQEKMLDGKSVVYIAQAGVLQRGNSIGYRLMQCVLTHFSIGTEFFVLTRIFNTNAKALYSQKLKFTPIINTQVKKLGYDEKYCGFQHITTSDEITKIKENQVIILKQIKKNTMNFFAKNTAKATKQITSQNNISKQMT